MGTGGPAADPGRDAAAPGPAAPYPAHREADVVLRDGSTVHVRPVKPSDLAAVRAFLQGLSLNSRAFRFFSAGANLERAAAQAIAVDHVNRYGLVATHGERVVGHAMYVRLDPRHAEAAFAVADELQGHGLGTILLAHLAEAARDAGFEVFVNEVLPENRRMVDVFRDSGFPAEMRSMPGYLQIDVPTSFTDDALDRFWAREQIAAAAALTAFLRPASVAVIALGGHDTAGSHVARNLALGGFAGSLWVVGHDPPDGAAPIPTAADLPEGIELAIVDGPPDAVLDVAAACGERGVRGLAVLSGGFSETGPDGARRERELLARCRGSGMRLLGPNCTGLINTDPEVRLNATAAATPTATGRIGLLSQSGAVGLAILDRARARGIGLSSFVSLGNKADISGNDVIQYWEQDPGTDMILLHLRSFGNPRNFGRIARRVGRVKPIVAVNASRAAGPAAPSTRSGALVASSEATVDALYRQSGVIRTRTAGELLDVASMLANQPIPSGDRVGVVANAAEAAALCVEACREVGLTVAPPSDPARRRLRSIAGADAAVPGPAVVLGSSATGSIWRRTVKLLEHRGGVDALIIVLVPPFDPSPDRITATLDDAVAGSPGRVPLIRVLMAAEETAGPDRRASGQIVAIPTFAFPEDAARALAHATRYAAWRAQPLGSIPAFPDVDADQAAAVIAGALDRGAMWLEPDEVERLLGAYGIPVADRRSSRSARGAAEAAAELGGPVALKAIGSTPFHRADVGGVRLNLSGRTAVERAAARMRSALSDAGVTVRRFEVQRMVDGGAEMLVGVVHDPTFGPVVAIASAGEALELVGDVAVRLTPLTDRDAAEMLRSLATFPLLDGYRGAARLDVAALEDILARVSALVEAQAAIAELDLDPVKVLERSALVLDARVRIEPAQAPPPLLARRSI